MEEALLAVPFGLGIGLLLGLVGGGGSILAVPVLVYALSQDVKAATTTSLLVVGATALAGALDHARGGRVRWRCALAFSAIGGVGSLLGTALNRNADPHVILLLFAVVLLAAAFGMLRYGGRGAEADRKRASWAKVVPIAFGLGTLTGFFGVGGGFLIVPALVVLIGMPASAAVGTSLLVIALTSSVAFSAHLASGEIDWPVAAAMTASAIVGAIVGSRTSGHVSQVRLRQGFAALVVVLALFLIAKNGNALV